MGLPLVDRGAVVARAPSDRLSAAFSGRSNSLGFLRWLLAALVVIGHSYPLGGFGDGTDPLYDWSEGQESFGGLAVSGFFILSGFLIMRSWLHRPAVGRFMWHRFLRIFPGFWVCLLVTAFAFAPVAWLLARGDLTGFLSEPDPGATGYVVNNLLLEMNQYRIGELLSGTPYGSVAGGVWNGSLWTLWYEFMCYLMVAALGLVGIIRRSRILIVALCTCAYGVMLATQISPAVINGMPVLADPWIARFVFLYLLGTLLALYDNHIAMSGRLALLAIAVIGTTLQFGGWLALGYPALAYLLLWLAVRLPFAAFDRPGDFSYGTYIYAFPIQMLLAAAGAHRLGLVPYVLLSLGVTTVAAAVSWHVVEKHALRLKGWSPRLPRLGRARAW